MILDEAIKITQQLVCNKCKSELFVEKSEVANRYDVVCPNCGIVREYAPKKSQAPNLADVLTLVTKLRESKGEQDKSKSKLKSGKGGEG